MLAPLADEMSEAHPPPPPPPPSFRNCLNRFSPPLRPKHAAVPYSENPPIQETSPTPELDAQGAAPQPPVAGQDGPQSPASYEDECISLPVQETDPAPQTCSDPQVSPAQPYEMEQVEDDRLAG